MGFFGKEKVNAAVTVLLLFAVILVFTIADIAGEDRLYSETENRLLASKPELSAENLIRGSFARDYENYVTDQFVSRDKWISIKTYVDLILQKQEMGGAGRTETEAVLRLKRLHYHVLRWQYLSVANSYET